MTPHQAFKTAFLMRAADEGLDLEQTHARVKQALAVVRGGAEKAALFEGLGGTALTGAAVLGLGVPAGVGWLGGKALAESRKDPLTVDEAKANEELAELQRLTDRARRLKQLRLQQHTIGV